jgi:hypothetical protein
VGGPAAPPDDQLPRPLRAALDHIDTEIRKIHEEAALAALKLASLLKIFRLEDV